MKRKKQNIKLVVLIGIIFTVILTAIIIFKINARFSKQEREFLKKYNLDGMSVEEIIEELDKKVDEQPGLAASVSGTKLKLIDVTETLELDIEENKFYLSIAPYIFNTHTCSIHNLITCRSELANKTFNVTIYNDDNEVILSGNYTSMKNGFVGIWLPKNINGRIVVKYNDKVAESNIATFKSSNTCLTTPLKLN